jgi:hypothetical protein
MNFLWSAILGLTFAAAFFVLLAVWLVPGFFARLWRALFRPAIAIGIMGWAFLAMAAVTQVDLTTQVKGILPTANGGTNSAFFTVAGPTVARTFTFPDASTTVLTTNAAVTVAQGGTGAATFTQHGVMIGNGGSTFNVTAAGTAGNCFTSNGASADPTWQACPGALNFADQEVPTGLINGANTTYTLAHTPNPALSLTCWRNGIEQRAGGADYTLATATITYGAAPLTGDTLICNYRY